MCIYIYIYIHIIYNAYMITIIIYIYIYPQPGGTKRGASANVPLPCTAGTVPPPGYSLQGGAVGGRCSGLG